jgi:molybdopterin converting factor small subunit
VSVRVRLSPLLRLRANGQDAMEVSGRTPLECIRDLVGQLPALEDWLYDGQGQLRPQVWVFVNDERVYEGELDKALQDGDEVLLMLSVAGG